MKWPKTYLLLFVFLLGLTAGMAQTVTVLSVETELPVKLAHVHASGFPLSHEKIFITDSTGVINMAGVFSPAEQIALKITCTGFLTRYDTIENTQRITFYLEPVAVTLTEMVITAQYAPNSAQNSVHKVKVIDQKKIEAMGAQNLRDVLSNELNVRLAQDNVLGSSMSLQGVSGQNVKILVDGVPVIGRLNGNIDLSQINMNNVERIEIIEGPLSVNYGTDALAGTINIISKKTQKKSFEISSNNYYESNGQYNFSGRIGYRKNKSLITLSGGRNYFDGWRIRDKPFQIEKQRIADSLRFKDWKPKEQWYGTLFFARYFNQLKLGYTADYFYEEIINRGLPRLPYHETAFDDYYKTNRINNSLNLTGELNKNYYINAVFAYNYYQRIKNTYFKDLTTLQETLTAGEGSQDTSSFNDITARGSISSTRDSSKIQFEAGYDIHHETATGLRILDKRQKLGDYAIFASAEYKPVEKLIIRPGLRAMYNTSYKAPLVPSLHVKYDINSANSLRFSYARGFRAPSLKELYFYFVDINHDITGNPDLQAERSHNFNLAWTANWNTTKTVFKIDQSFFYNYINNMISLALGSGTSYSYFNIDVYQTMGAQLQGEMAWRHLKLAAGVAYIGRYNQLSEDFESEKFIYTPEAKCNLMYEWYKQNITFAVFYKYTGKLPSYGLDENNQLYNNEMQDYHTADFSISKLCWRKQINISVGGKNMFNVRNVSGSVAGGAHSGGGNSIPVAMGRTWFAKIDFNLTAKK